MKTICSPGCENREENCHSTCEKYQEFVKENERRKEERFKQKNLAYLSRCKFNKADYRKG